MNFELAKRTKRHPLSKPQLDVLRVLADGIPRATARRSFANYVCGTATAALERRGLVKMCGADAVGGWTYRITKAGLEALHGLR